MHHVRPLTLLLLKRHTAGLHLQMTKSVITALATTWRQRTALQLLLRRGVVHEHELPTGVGFRTMATLVKKGLAEPIELKIGKTRRNAWQLVEAKR